MFWISCPFCGHSFHIKRDTMLIHGMDEGIEKRLADGSYFTHECQHCKKLFYMMHPFLFRDPDRKYVLILSNQESFNNLPVDEQVVVCDRVPDFLLAYKIFSQGADARVVLRVKKQLEARYEGSVVFDSYDCVKNILWFEIDKQMVAVCLDGCHNKGCKK